MVVEGGGWDGSEMLSSTEIYVNSAWSSAASLPSPRSFISSATVNNSVFVFGLYIYFKLNLISIFYFFIGGYDPSQHDDILHYNPVTDSWTQPGEMSTPRAFHAITVVPNLGKICSS